MHSCGLYLKLHSKMRPKEVADQALSRRSKKRIEREEREAAGEVPQCANCGATSTPMWRKDKDKNLSCNACSLYFKLRGCARPASLQSRKKRVSKIANRVAAYNKRPAPSALPGASGPLAAAAAGTSASGGGAAGTTLAAAAHLAHASSASASSSAATSPETPTTALGSGGPRSTTGSGRGGTDAATASAFSSARGTPNPFSWPMTTTSGAGGFGSGPPSISGPSSSSVTSTRAQTPTDAGLAELAARIGLPASLATGDMPHPPAPSLDWRHLQALWAAAAAAQQQQQPAQHAQGSPYMHAAQQLQQHHAHHHPHPHPHQQQHQQPLVSPPQTASGGGSPMIPTSSVALPSHAFPGGGSHQQQQQQQQQTPSSSSSSFAAQYTHHQFSSQQHPPH